MSNVTNLTGMSISPSLPTALAKRHDDRRQELLGDDGGGIEFSQPLQMKENLWLELKGEMLGTGVLILGIVAGNATMARREADEGDDFNLDLHSKTMFGNLGGAFSVVAAFFVSFDSSGAHVNPAVTFAFMLFDGFPVRKGILYMVAQLIGSFLASLLCCMMFTGLGSQDEKYVTNFYHTSPSPGTDMLTAFLAEIQCTAMLLCGIKFLAHGTAPKPNKFVMGFGIGTLVFFILTNMGYLSGGCLNPAREFPPRVMRFIDSWVRGKGIEGTFDTWEWLCPTFAPMIGAPLGIAMYKLCSNSDAQKAFKQKQKNKKMDEVELS